MTLDIHYHPEMTIRFKHGGLQFEADTAEEAAKMVSLLEERESQRKQARIQGMLKEGRTDEVHEILTQGSGTWTPELFLRFIDRLGESQRAILALLVNFRHATDEELRACVNVDGNQGLAGVLSGISKQAAALDIDARDVFTFENLRSGGKRQSNYRIANKFAEIAQRMNWPGPSEKTRQ